MRTSIFVLLALGVASQGAARPTLRDAILAPMSKAYVALQAQRYATALAGFRTAQTILDRHPLRSDTYDDRMVRAATTFLVAKTLGEGKLGDPCASLAAARTTIDSLREPATRNPPDAALLEMNRDAARDIAKARVTYRCVDGGRPATAPVPVALAGHYYRSGIRETGSELLLRPDGSYDYFITYGAVDLFSTGRWRRDGDRIVLDNTKPSANTPLFTLGSFDPWDADAENWVQKERHEALVKAIRERCPFLAEQDAESGELGVSSTVMTPPALSSADLPVAVLAAELDKAEARELSARRRYEGAALQAMRHDKAGPANWVEARSARHAWNEARAALNAASTRATVSDAPPPRLELPSMCVVPEEVDAASIPQQRWVRGFAVVIADPQVGMTFKNVDVTFRFANGARVERKTVRGGMAWVEIQARAPLSGIELNYRGAGRDSAQPQDFAMSHATAGVQRVMIDSRQFAEPAFGEMKLSIHGDDLVLAEGRGRYAKAR